RPYPGHVRLPGVAAPLPAEMIVFPAPHTYTGQHVAELHTAGCPPLVELLIAELLRVGARAARPGEFTLRAFLAGKLDLTRAEAVLGVIEAGSRDELKEALAQLAGGVTRPLHELRGDLLDLLADLEAGLDFAEEDIHFVSPEDLLRRLGKGLALLTLLGRQLEQRALAGRPVRAGRGRAGTVAAGRPPRGGSGDQVRSCSGIVRRGGDQRGDRSRTRRAAGADRGPSPGRPAGAGAERQPLPASRRGVPGAAAA